MGDYACVVCWAAITDLGGGRQCYTCSAAYRAEAVRRRAARTYANHPECRERYVAAHRERKVADPAFAARLREQGRARRKGEGQS